MNKPPSLRTPVVFVVACVHNSYDREDLRVCRMRVRCTCCYHPSCTGVVLSPARARSSSNSQKRCGKGTKISGASARMSLHVGSVMASVPFVEGRELVSSRLSIGCLIVRGPWCAATGQAGVWFPGHPAVRSLPEVPPMRPRVHGRGALCLPHALFAVHVMRG